MARLVSLQGRARLVLRALGAAGAIRLQPVVPPTPRAARPVVLPPLVGAEPRVIAQRVRRTTVDFLMDDSGSMYFQWGDGSGVRYAAALSLLGLMRRHGGGRAGVVHWGTSAPPEMRLAPVDVKSGRRALQESLKIPPTLGGNDLPAALRAAAQGAAGLAQDETYLVFVITDGIESVTPAMHAAVAALPPGSVHMLLVDRSNGCTEAMEADWRTVAFGSFTRLRTFDTKEMAGQIADIFAGALGLEVRAPAAAASP